MSKIKRDSTTGRFVMGQKAFAKVSSVEGIRASKSLREDLKRYKNVSDEHRRTAVAEKYSKSGK